MNIGSKLPKSGITIFTKMSKLALEYNAINLSQGFPDFDIDPKLKTLVNQKINEGFNQYAPMQGHPLLTEVLAEKIHTLYHRNIHPADEITITPGATYGIYASLATILLPGDEVIVLEPAYDSYIPNIEILGGIPVCIELNPDDFSIPWETVREKITTRTKAIIINSPHNPCGYVWSEEDLRELEQCLRDKDIFVISDEVYEHLTFDGKKHWSILDSNELYEKSFIVFSFGKVLHATGWKVGYVVAPPSFTSEFRKIHQFLAFSVNTPMQIGIAEFMQDENNYLPLNRFFQGKRDLFLDIIAQTPLEVLNISGGTYFQVVSFKGISDKRDTAFAEELTQKIGVACIPLSPFYQMQTDQKVLRFCFAKRNETLEKAGERLLRL